MCSHGCSMEDYKDPKTGEEVTVVEQIQVAPWMEFTKGRIDHYDPEISLEGGIFPDDYAIPMWLSDEVEGELGLDVSEYGVRVIDTDEWESV